MAAVDSLHASLCELLGAMMAEITGHAPPRPHSSFLALGGGETEARELAHMVNALFGLELPPDAVLRSPTPDSLARTIESSWGASPADLVALVAAIGDDE
jgi:hypothetical protein